MATRHKSKKKKKVETRTSFSKEGNKKSYFLMIKDYFDKMAKNNIIVFFIFLFIAVYLTVSIRTFSWDLKAIEYNYVKNYENYIKNSLKQELLKNFVVQPPEDQLNILVEKQFQQLKNEMGVMYKKQLQSMILQAKKDFQNDNNETYLLAIDPYYYYRRVKNLVEKGSICDEFRNGLCWDNHMIAPLGVPTGPTLHDYFSYYFYKFVKLFDKKHSLMGIMFFVPVVVMAFSVIVAYLLGFFITRSNLIALIFSLLIGFNTNILSRTIGGFADTDAYNIFFPLLISLFVLLSYKYRKNYKLSIMFLVLFAISQTLFVFAWAGWWFILDVILGAVALELLYRLFRWLIAKLNSKKRSKKDFKTDYRMLKKDFLNSLTFFVMLLVILQLFLQLFANQSILNAILRGKGATKLKVAAHNNLWPNVFTTVAELNFGTISDIINVILNPRYLVALNFNPQFASFVTKIFLLFALFSVVIFLLFLIEKLFILKHKFPSLSKFLEDVGIEESFSFMFFLFLVWFLVMSYATLEGIRFAMYIATPYAFFVSFGIYALIRLINKKIANQTVYYLSAFFILLLFLLPSYASARFLAINTLPSMSDGWYRSLTYIRENSKPDAIINSWWDFGHWFKAIADRAVTFDGGSQNTPMAHWIGKVLQTSDPKLALSILRMLDCHSNGAFEVLFNRTNDTLVAINWLYDLLKMNSSDAVKFLKAKNFSDEEIERFLNYAFCTPPENFFITSEDMVYKAGVWAHFGLWNFSKAKLWQVLRKLPYNQRIDYLMKNYNMSRVEASNFATQIETLLKQQDPERSANNWISLWPSYIGNKLHECKLNNNTLECDLNFGFNVENANVILQKFVFNQTFAKFYGQVSSGYQVQRFETSPALVYDVITGDIKRYNSSLNFGVAVYGNKILLADPNLVASMFTKLFYFEDGGKYFIKAYKDYAAGTGKVIVWKVNWRAIIPNYGE